MQVIPKTTTRETMKTVVIAILITAIVAFVGGVKYEQAQTAQLKQAVKPTVVVQTVKE